MESLVVVDTERAALRGAPHLVEVGAVRVVRGEVEDHFQRLVRPQIEIEDDAFAIHGIGVDDVAAAAEAPEILEAFLAWAGSDWLVAHNARADAAVLGYELARHGLDAPGNLLLDTLPLARRALPDAPDHKLATLAQHLELEIDGHHRALEDATLCAQVLEHCVAELGGWEACAPAELVRLCAAPVTLASARPAAPRPGPRVRALRRAAERGETVHVLYGDGQHDVATIELAPRFLFRHRRQDYVEALCPSSGTLKTYRLDRVRRVLPRRPSPRSRSWS